MNIDPSGSRNTDQTSTMIDDLASSVGYVKSYRCTFCKRGFSSAQALGGHMNIHRRDRAKLREFSDDKLLTLDIGKSKDSQNNSSSGEKLMIRSKAGHDRDHGKVDHSPNLVWRLPIIAEAATPPERGGDQEREAGGGGGFGKHLEESGGGVDLELRLGLEPS